MAPAQHPKSVGIWIRVSTEDQARGDSPEHHEQRARLYAEAQEYDVREVYRLDAVSGKSVMEHPEAQRMLADVRSGKIRGLIFSKLARLARNTRELLDFADIFREHDAALISLQESLDTGTAAGRFFYTLIGGLAEWERSEIADRVAASVPIRAKLGKPLGGPGIYGYHWQDGKLVPHPDEAPIRRLMYELYLEHRRKKTVVKILNDRGYRTRKGKKYVAKVFEDLIRDPTAKGLRRANYTTRRETGKYQRKAETEWIYVPVEPIVSEELWEECNRILLSQKEGVKTPGPRPHHLFGGVVRCTCGDKMYARRATGKYACSSCSMKIPAADLEAIYHTQLEGALTSADVAAYLDRAEESIAEYERLMAVRADERERVQKDIDRLYDLYLSGEIPKEGFGTKLSPMEERQKQIDTQLLELQVQIDIAKIARVNRDHMLSEAQALHDKWPYLPDEDKRYIIQNVTDEIVVGKDEIQILLKNLPLRGNADAKGTYKVGSPEGWLWTRMIEEALSASARLTTSRG